MSRSFPAVRAVRSDGAAAVVWASVLAAASLAIAPLTMNMVKADPSFYLSYVLDYEAIAARFGQTYHGNRLSYLLIDRAAFAVLGPEAGYFAARWFVLSVAVLAAIGISRRVLGRAGALSVGAAVALTPWLPRQLLWVHYDGFAATYLLVAAWLLLGPVEQRWRRPIAGVVLALAVNANLAALVLVAGAVLGWILAVDLPFRERVRGVVGVAVGFIAAELALSLVLRIFVGGGPWFIETVAIRVALFLSGEENSSWFEPLSVVLRASPQLLLVPVVVAVGMMARPKAGTSRAERSDAGARIDVGVFGSTWLLASGLAVLGLHFGIESSWLANSFYVVQLLPPLLVGLVGAASRAADPALRPHAGWPELVVPLLVAVVLGLLWSRAALVPFALGLAFLALVVLLVLVRRSAAAPGVVGGGLVAVVLAATFGAPLQAVSAGGWADVEERERYEWTVFHHLRDVQALVEREVPSDRDLVFWHRTEPPEGEWLRWINMAYYGTGGGRLHIDKGDRIGMPELAEWQVDGLLARAPVTVVLLGLERAEVTAGYVELLTRIPDARQTGMTVFDGDVFDVHVALVEVG